jgi:hypothetical protein
MGGHNSRALGSNELRNSVILMLKEQHSEELVHFLDAITIVIPKLEHLAPETDENGRLLHESTRRTKYTSSEVRLDMERLLNTFIINGSSKQVNISSRDRKELKIKTMAFMKDSDNSIQHINALYTCSKKIRNGLRAWIGRIVMQGT